MLGIDTCCVEGVGHLEFGCRANVGMRSVLGGLAGKHNTSGCEMHGLCDESRLWKSENGPKIWVRHGILRAWSLR